jgi:hypothetical protein
MSDSQKFTTDGLCPDHPTQEPEMGFGLAGGGYGAYSYCPICHRILEKTQEHDEPPPQRQR